MGLKHPQIWVFVTGLRINHLSILSDDCIVNTEMVEGKSLNSSIKVKRQKIKIIEVC